MRMIKLRKGRLLISRAGGIPKKKLVLVIVIGLIVVGTAIAVPLALLDTSESTVVIKVPPADAEDDGYTQRSYYEATIGGRVVGTEYDVVDIGFYSPSILTCYVKREPDNETTMVRYVYEATTPHDESLGSTPRSSFEKYVGEAEEPVIEITGDFGRNECPIFEPDVIGLVQELISAYFSLYGYSLEERIQAIIPSRGNSRTEVAPLQKKLIGYNRNFSIQPDNFEIYALFNPEQGTVVRLYLPSEDLEIYELEEPGGSKSASYYFTLAHDYFEHEMYEESRENAARAVEVDPYYKDMVEWLYRKIEKAESS